jgi:PleD family two-component response regulator
MWPIAVSIGASVCRPGDSLKDWIAQADEALYRAQQEGRNRVRRAMERAA